MRWCEGGVASEYRLLLWRYSLIAPRADFLRKTRFGHENCLLSGQALQSVCFSALAEKFRVAEPNWRATTFAYSVAQYLVSWSVFVETGENFVNNTRIWRCGVQSVSNKTSKVPLAQLIPAFGWYNLFVAPIRLRWADRQLVKSAPLSSLTVIGSAKSRPNATFSETFRLLHQDRAANEGCLTVNRQHHWSSTGLLRWWNWMVAGSFSMPRTVYTISQKTTFSLERANLKPPLVRECLNMNFVVGTRVEKSNLMTKKNDDSAVGEDLSSTATQSRDSELWRVSSGGDAFGRHVLKIGASSACKVE
jgi:hypothetical protein